VDNHIVTAFRIDKMARLVPRFFEEIGYEVLMKFLGFGVVAMVEELDKIGFEPFDIRSVGLYLSECFVE
jgi:hypothetical protein